MVQIRWEGFGGDLVQLQAQLEHLLQQASGRAALIMDSAGRLLTVTGETPECDVTTFVSLLAADFCATRELARILEEEDFHSVSHEGQQISLYMTQISETIMLAMTYDRQTTLGLVRYAIRQARPRLAATLQASLENSAPDPRLGREFRDEALEQVDRLFGSQA